MTQMDEIEFIKFIKLKWMKVFMKFPLENASNSFIKIQTIHFLIISRTNLSLSTPENLCMRICMLFRMFGDELFYIRLKILLS